MKFTFFVDDSREEEVIVYARERNELVNRIEDLVTEKSCEIAGFNDGTAEILDTDSVFCFIVENGRVFALTEKEKYRIRERLYTLEEKLGSNFIRINQSCIANISKIKRFEHSPYGSLTVVLKNGTRDYISRRNIKKVKERFGI